MSDFLPRHGLRIDAFTLPRRALAARERFEYMYAAYTI